MAATYDVTRGAAAIPMYFDAPGRAYLLVNEIDFSSDTEFTATATATDIVKCLDIPANTFVAKVGVIVLTAEGATCTATVGDSSAADWDASVNLNSASAVAQVSLEATDTYGPGKLYTAADDIRLVLGHQTDDAKIKVFAACYDMTKLGTNAAAHAYGVNDTA